MLLVSLRKALKLFDLRQLRLVRRNSDRLGEPGAAGPSPGIRWISFTP